MATVATKRSNNYHAVPQQSNQLKSAGRPMLHSSQISHSLSHSVCDCVCACVCMTVCVCMCACVWLGWGVFILVRCLAGGHFMNAIRRAFVTPLPQPQRINHGHHRHSPLCCVAHCCRCYRCCCWLGFACSSILRLLHLIVCVIKIVCLRI